MKLKYLILTTPLLLAALTNSAYADNYSEQIAFADGANANLSFTFDLGTGYFTNVDGLVSGSLNSSANGAIKEELGAYLQFADYTPETFSPETPGSVFALFNSNNAGTWTNTTAIYENFTIRNNQLAVDVANYGTAAAQLFYPAPDYSLINLNSTNSYSLIDTSINPVVPAPLSSSVPLPSALILFGSAMLGFISMPAFRSGEKNRTRLAG